MTEFKTLVAGALFTECPRWHDGRLFYSDAFAGKVYAVSLDGEQDVIASVPNRPSGLGWLPDGRMLVVSMLDRRILRLEDDGALVEHANLAMHSDWDLNDMVVDTLGRAFVGTYGFDFSGGGAVKPGTIIRVDPDGSAHPLGPELLLPNGMCVTPDQTTLIVSEWLGNRLSSFTIAADGSLGARRTWAEFGPYPKTDAADKIIADSIVVPDGICLDADGAVWVADPLRQRVLRVAEGGRILDVRTLTSGAFACALGGRDGRTLFVCASPLPETGTESDSTSDWVQKEEALAEIVFTRVDAPRSDRQ